MQRHKIGQASSLIAGRVQASNSFSNVRLTRSDRILMNQK